MRGSNHAATVTSSPPIRNFRCGAFGSTTRRQGLTYEFVAAHLSVFEVPCGLNQLLPGTNG